MKIPFTSPKDKNMGKLSSSLLSAAETVSRHEQKISDILKIFNDPKYRQKKLKKKFPLLLRFSYKTGKKIYRHWGKINKALLSIASVIEYQITKF